MGIPSIDLLRTAEVDLGLIFVRIEAWYDIHRRQPALDHESPSSQKSRQRAAI